MSKECPEGWAVSPLGNLVEVLDGRRVPINSNERAKRAGSVPYFGATGQVGWIDDHLFDEELVLVGEDGAPFLDKSKAIAYLIDGKSWVNNHAHVLRARATTSNIFVKYALDATKFDEFVNGTTRLKLTQGAMVTIPIPVPPLAEQHRIIEKVEFLFEQVKPAKDRLDRVSRMLKRFRQAVLSAACSGELTRQWRKAHRYQAKARVVAPDDDLPPLPELPEEWSLAPLNEAVERFQYGTSEKADADERTGVPVVRMGNIQDGRLDLSDLKFIKKSSALDEFFVRPGDVLFNRTNSPELVGKTAVADPDRPMVFASYLIRAQAKPRIVRPEFVSWWLNSAWGRLWARHVRADGVSQSNINASKLAAMPVPLPSLDEQDEALRVGGQVLALADAIERRVQAARTRAEKLPQAILLRAFSGELVPTEAELARAEGRSYETADELLARVRVNDGRGDDDTSGIRRAVRANAAGPQKHRRA